jgi:DNA repair ATPase RecN
MDGLNVTETLMEIREKVSSIQTQMQHVSARLDGKSNDIKEIEKRLDVLEKRHDETYAKWFDYIVKSIMTILLGYLALRLGLK